MQSEFELEVREEDSATVIAVSGELDLASSPALEEELERAGNRDTSLVIVDLRKLDFMDSTGLSVLVRGNNRAAEKGQRFAIVNGSAQVQRLLALTGIADRMTVVDSPDELLNERRG